MSNTRGLAEVTLVNNGTAMDTSSFHRSSLNKESVAGLTGATTGPGRHGSASDVKNPVKPVDPGKNVDLTKFEITKTVPEKNERRTLVLCFDGTGDQFDSDNSNIVQFVRMLRKDGPNQLVYYQAGIGTYVGSKHVTAMGTAISKNLDMAVAWNLDNHIISGYEFLMQNYRTEDKICIFGFSRGAFTARCLAGMLHKVGLLPACNHEQVPFAYKMYTQADDQGWKMSNMFKKTFSIDVDIDFLGVWDTVESVGLFAAWRTLPKFPNSNFAVKVFRHALALDERRAKFQPSYFTYPEENDLKNRSKTDENKAKANNLIKKHDNECCRHSENGGDYLPSEDGKIAFTKLEDQLKEEFAGPEECKHNHVEKEKQHIRDRVKQTDVMEVWFAGSHCDVGGGSHENHRGRSLARIPLRWMIRECFKANTGILFLRRPLKRIGLNPASLLNARTGLKRPAVNLADDIPIALPESVDLRICERPSAKSKEPKSDKTQSEELFDLEDALAPIYDQLKLKRLLWWPLEIIPMSHKYQKRDPDRLNEDQVVCKSAKSPTRWNLFRGRHVSEELGGGKIKVHYTVKLRTMAKDKKDRKYVPALHGWESKAKDDNGKIEWVD